MNEAISKVADQIWAEVGGPLKDQSTTYGKIVASVASFLSSLASDIEYSEHAIRGDIEGLFANLKEDLSSPVTPKDDDPNEFDIHVWREPETEDMVALYTLSRAGRGIAYHMPLDDALESLREELEGDDDQVPTEPGDYHVDDHSPCSLPHCDRNHFTVS